MSSTRLSSSAVIAAAAELADEVGYDSVTLAGIARSLGVQTPNLYSYVRDRASLLDGVRELALGELAYLVNDAIAGKAGRDALQAMAEIQRRYARDHPGRWIALLRPFSTVDAKSEGAVRMRRSGYAVLRGYDLPEEELQHAGRMIDSMINGFIGLERSGMLCHFETDADPEVSWRRILAAVDKSLSNWPTSPPSR